MKIFNNIEFCIAINTIIFFQFVISDKLVGYAPAPFLLLYILHRNALNAHCYWTPYTERAMLTSDLLK